MDFIVNETPVKTSKNYRINHLNLGDYCLPEVKDFPNIQVNCPDSATLSSEKQQVSLEYGMNSQLIQQSHENSNHNLQIRFAANQKLERPVEIDCSFCEESPHLVSNISISSEKHSKSHVILKFKGESGDFFLNSILDIQLEEEAELTVTVLNFLPYPSKSFFTQQCSVAKLAKFHLTFVDFGGKYSVSNLFTEALDQESHTETNVIYIGKQEQVLDYNIIARLSGKRCHSRMEVQGVLDHAAQKFFKGTLDFRQGATESVGYENEFCTMLSEDCSSVSLPMLLCQEEDVDGTHSSASGKIDEDILFYLQSRGIPEEDARKLMVKANFHHIIQQTPWEETREEILREVEGRIN